MINIRKTTIGKRVLDVMTETEYTQKTQKEGPMFDDTCIEKNGMLYPIQQRYDGFTPGVFDAGPFLKYTNPQESDVAEYSAGSDKIIDFSRAKDLRSLIVEQDKLRDKEEVILTVRENIFQAHIKDSNLPELKATKEVINSKNIDLTDYKVKLEEDFSNITRIIKDPNNDSITFNRMRTLMNAMDVEVTLTFKDKPNAINPMGKEISVVITSED